MDSFIQRMFREYLLSPRHCPRHWAVAEATKHPVLVELTLGGGGEWDSDRKQVNCIRSSGEKLSRVRRRRREPMPFHFGRGLQVRGRSVFQAEGTASAKAPGGKHACYV